MLQTLAAFLKRNWFIVALVLFFVGLSVKYSFKAFENRSAILRWKSQVKGFSDGEDIFERYNYPNPPIMAMLLLPLASLPPVAAALTWFYLKVAMALLTLVWAFRLIETPERPFPGWAKALTVLLSLRPIVGDLEHGNVNLFILFLIVAGLTAFRRGWSVLCGSLIGLSVACKVTPLLFFPYFVWKRQWRVLAGGALGLFLFLWLVPGLYSGFEENQRDLASWYREMVHPFVVEGKVWSEHNNQSLPGLIARLLTESPSFSTYVENVYTPVAYHNVAALDRGSTRLLENAFRLAFVLAIVFCCRTPIPPRSGWRLGAEFAIVSLGMLLFSERTWKHHCVTLVLPFAVLCYHLAVCSPRTWGGKGIVAALLLATALMATTSTGLLPDEWAKLAQVYGAYVAAYFVLLAALLTLLRRPDKSITLPHELRNAA